MSTAGQMGSWALNPDTGALVLSREAYPIFRFDSDGDPPTCPMVVARIHPDDRDRVGESAERSFREGTSLEGGYRILLPDGGVTHLHYVGHRVTQASGKGSEYVGTLGSFLPQRECSLRQRIPDSVALLFLDLFAAYPPAVRNYASYKTCVPDVF